MLSYTYIESRRAFDWKFRIKTRKWFESYNKTTKPINQEAAKKKISLIENESEPEKVSVLKDVVMISNVFVVKFKKSKDWLMGFTHGRIAPFYLPEKYSVASFAFQLAELKLQ